MTKPCDNTSVGVIIRDRSGCFALLKRAKFPIGIAPPAGHIDNHGSPEQAALKEVSEELGLKLSDLTKTAIYGRLVDASCSRPGGDHHIWYVYTALTDTTLLKADPKETKGADWYTLEQLRRLAERTRAYYAGRVSETDWAAKPGLEEVWLPFMEELGYTI